MLVKFHMKEVTEIVKFVLLLVNFFAVLLEHIHNHFSQCSFNSLRGFW